MDASILQRLIIFFGPLLFALCFHEMAHGLVAKWRGDRTAERLGRITMNPMAHADLVGTFIFPLTSIFLNLPFSFGWAKPVPVDTRNLKNQRTDMFWIALAGPLSNLFLAVVATVIIFMIVKLNLFASYHTGIFELFKSFLIVNLYLAVFNIIPLHPLDGGKVLARFLPEKINIILERNEGMSNMILILFLVLGLFSILQHPVLAMYHFLISFLV